MGIRRKSGASRERTHYELLFVGKVRQTWVSGYFADETVLEERSGEVRMALRYGYEVALVVEDPEPIPCPTCGGSGTVSGGA